LRQFTAKDFLPAVSIAGMEQPFRDAGQLILRSGVVQTICHIFRLAKRKIKAPPQYRSIKTPKPFAGGVFFL
jgi:hypothetical protein